MSHIKLSKVRARYEVLSVRDYNLKRRVVQTLRRSDEPRIVIDALNGIDLEIEEGSRLGLVGANGAGKSTLLSVMAGLLPPTSGKVEVRGRVLALLGGAGAGLDQEATGRDNIVSMGVQLGEQPASMRARIEDITEFSGLGGRIDHPVYSYSSGMQTRLRFSILTSLQPDILLLDEGMGTADAEFSGRAGERLGRFVSAAGILVIASHNDDFVRELSDTAVWLSRGSAVLYGDVSTVLASYAASLPDSTTGDSIDDGDVPLEDSKVDAPA
jgi:ABC-2 type transport system ATP-binding protein